MKSVKLSLFAAVASLCFVSFNASAQQVAKKAPVKGQPTVAAATDASKNMTPSTLAWKEEVHSFGDIEKGKPVSNEFTFKNTTKQTILITNVKPSCGCTAANYTKTPIKPGETGTVTATYNAAAVGSFTKTIQVTTNDSDAPKVLTIKGKVLDTAAPATQQ